MATIALVEPEPPGYHVYSGFKLPRMGLPSIGAVLWRLGHRVSIYCQNIRAAPRCAWRMGPSRRMPGN